MKYILTLFVAVLAFTANAGDSAVAKTDSIVSKAKVEKPVEMADKFYADGGIYVVIAVITVILLGLFGYMIYVDNRLGKLEKEQKN